MGRVARYTLLSGHRYLAGCASVPLGDGGTPPHTPGSWAAPATPHRRTPGHPAPPLAAHVPAPDRPALAPLPPLLRGYLRIGARICGAPAHDPDFDVADFSVVLDMEQLGDRYRRYFLGER